MQVADEKHTAVHEEVIPRPQPEVSAWHSIATSPTADVDLIKTLDKVECECAVQNSPGAWGGQYMGIHMYQIPLQSRKNTQKV